MRLGEIVIESSSRIISADRRVPVDTSVVLRQLCPQQPASEVVAFGIVANDDLGRGWQVWLPRNRHGLNAASHSSRRGTAVRVAARSAMASRSVHTTQPGDSQSRERRQVSADGLARFSSGADRPNDSAKLPLVAMHRRVKPNACFGISGLKRVRRRLPLRARLLVRKRSTLTALWRGSYASGSELVKRIHTCCGPHGAALLSTTTSAGGAIGEALAYTEIFANHYKRFFLRSP